MLLRAVLFLLAVALALFLASLGLQKSALQGLAAFAATLGSAILLAGFALLLALGIVYALRCIAGDAARYFSRTERVLRKLLFAESRRRELQQRRFSELRQLDYVNALTRARLQRANDKRHVRLLAGSLYRQLHAARGAMPRVAYKELCQAIRRSRRRCDGEALLALQKRIAMAKLL